MSDMFELAVVLFLTGVLTVTYGISTHNEFMSVIMGLATTVMIVFLFTTAVLMMTA